MLYLALFSYFKHPRSARSSTHFFWVIQLGLQSLRFLGSWISPSNEIQLPKLKNGTIQPKKLIKLLKNGAGDITSPMINHDIPSPISPMNLCLRYNWLLSHVSNEVIATPGRVMFDVWLRDGAIISTGLSPWIIDKSMIMVTCYKIWIPLYFSGCEGFWLHSKCQQGARTSGLANVCKKNTSWNPRALDGPIAGSCCIDVQEWGITYSSWLSCIRQLMMSIIHGHFDEDSVRFRNGKTYFP